MGEFFAKVENFLFDVLGLIVPGFIFILILFAPLILTNFPVLESAAIQQSQLLNLLYFVNVHYKTLYSFDSTAIAVLFILFCYIVGHTLKVFVIIFYEVGESLFDKVFNLWLSRIYAAAIQSLTNKMGAETRNACERILGPLNKVFRRTMEKVFEFKSPPFYKENENLVTSSVGLINDRLGTTFPKDWYSLYKFSVVANAQVGLKSISGFFLAKYNLYRSLSFIFFLSFLYYLFFFKVGNDFLKDSATNIQRPILLMTILLWFTFHVKFKRYWTLCGNDSLMTLYFYLNRTSIGGEKQKE